MTLMPIFDGHNDFLWCSSKRSFLERSEEGHLDLIRAREGGFGGGFFAVFVPQQGSDDLAGLRPAPKVSANGYEYELAQALEYEYAFEFVKDRVERLFKIEEESKGQVKVVRTTGELEFCLESDILAAILHFEGAEAIDEDLRNLEAFYEQGLRSLGLVWSRPNAFGHGVPFKFPSSPDTGPGLTDSGKDLVKACNRLGVMLDMSHLNEKGFWDVAGLTDAPIVATHSAAHAIAPKTRNLTDKQLDAIGETGGVVGVNFAKYDLVSDGRIEGEVSLVEIVRHVAYIAERIGIDCVALGSDFDGTKVPDDLKDVSGLPKLVTALRNHGFDEDSLRKVTHQNWVRVLERTWKD